MKKKLLAVLGLSALLFSLGACGGNGGNGGNTGDNPGPGGEVVTRYTVAFEVDGVRYKTLSVKEGEKITEDVPNPEKEGFKFDCWMEGTTRVEDLKEYVVTKNTTFTAKFVEAGNVLNVDDTKDSTKSYYLVLGWWESTDVENASFPYSGLTKESVRLFYGNLINYLKAVGATDANIAAISFRNYSSNGVAAMGTAVNADGDVEILIGAGANVFTTAGCLPFHESADSKFGTVMGTAGKERQVAILQNASEVAQAAFTWLQTDAGKKSFVAELTADEIAQSLVPEEINLIVTVHGDTTESTTLTDKTTAITMPTITVPEGKVFKGFATSVDGEVVLEKAKDATLKYDDVKGLVAEGSQTLDLYPVFEEAPVAQADLCVLVQTHATRLPEYEAELLAARFNATTDKNVKFEFSSTSAADFTTLVNASAGVADVVIGGNNPVANLSLSAEGPVANAGAKHFADTSRKVAILSTGNSEHVALAKQFYDFVVADAVEYRLHTTFWTKNNEWVTADEVTAIKAGMQAQVASYMHIGEGETLKDKYNVDFDWYECTNTKVGDLGAETLALRDGKGTDFIVGCGSNVTSTGLVEVADKKVAPTTIIAGNRYVAVVSDNGITRDIYNNYFAEPVSE